MTSQLPLVLCLHGFGQTAETFRERTASFRSRFKNKYEFLCPLGTQALEGPDQRRAHWVYDRKNPNAVRWANEYDKHESVASLLGYEQTEEAVRALFAEHKERIRCVLGFSQGGAAVALLCQRGVIPEHVPVVLACAFYPLRLPADADAKARARIQNPSLHCIGQRDDIIAPAVSEQLASFFANPVFQRHSGKHVIPKVVLPFS
jgi:predicted esterase